MTTTRHRLARSLAVPTLLLAALALVACGGNGDEDPAATPTATVAAATVEATPDFLVASPDDLDTYRYTVAVTLSPDALDTADAPMGLPLDENFTIEITGDVVNPDREHATTVVNLGFLTLSTETIRIGEDEWARQGRSAWQPATAGGGLSDFLGDADFSPTSIFQTGDGFSFEALTARLQEHEWEAEEVNGVQSRHYTFTEEEFYATFNADQEIVPADIVDASLTADLWIAEDLGVPVRMVIVGADADGAEVMRVEMDLSDINSDIEVDAPI
ncbi:MAG: hypothetical protein WD800_02105 [Dehalococcoidia bacterium]